MFASGKTASASSGASSANYIEDVFSTYLYNGTGATQTITNGIDLSTKGGLVWIKTRSDTGGVYTGDHVAHDTARGVNKTLRINSTAAQSTRNGVTAFNADGFTTGGLDWENRSGMTYASWTFRKQPKFFDVVTYTGDGTSNRQISHSLGSTPGFIVVKATNNASQWYAYHRSVGDSNTLYLNLTVAAASTSGNPWTPTSTTFTVDSTGNLNGSGVTYVAYLFAHNAGGFGLNGTDNVISCGSFTPDSSGNVDVNLGYEPQWILFKRSAAVGSWSIADTMRGMSYSDFNRLYANLSDAEDAQPAAYCVPTATGFKSVTTGVFSANEPHIYIAIRRGPMKVPTSGTSVFAPVAQTGGGTVTTNFPVDMAIYGTRSSGTNNHAATDRLRGADSWMLTNTTGAETQPLGAGVPLLGINNSNVGYTDNVIGAAASVYWNMRRAPSFFDEVCYTGTGALLTVNHNLATAPELIIAKRRNSSVNGAWWVYYTNYGATNYGEGNLNTTGSVSFSPAYDGNWDLNTKPTSSSFQLTSVAHPNVSGGTYVAYLFATCAGVSKVGSYTGTGTTLQVDCGFTGGARFVLIKRTDSTGDWYVWDSARGIVAGNDPYLLLNSTAAEVTNTDYVDTYSAGFEISSTAPAAINASGGTFIFLAIA